MKQIPVAVAHGDGIGPEIMQATLAILRKANAPLDIHEVEIGERVYLQGHTTGIEPATWETLRKTQAFLKAPITTPQGGGFKSLNVTIRTSLGLFANIRPCVSYAPFISTKHPKMDVVIVRENEEDLYAGIEYQQSPHVCESIKLISKEGSEKIIRYAFEYAKAFNRKKVSCFTKDNIMKFSDGLFHKVFDCIAKEYPDIEHEHWIVDIGAAKLADTPEAFDVVVLPNLYGDILSDVAAQISGSVGLAGSANIGAHGAMFEAIHGSAPRRAGKNMANPSGLLHGAILMLQYLGLNTVASNVLNAWLKTIEEGIHTYDIYKENVSKSRVSTHDFAKAVCENLDKKPKHLPVAKPTERAMPSTFAKAQLSMQTKRQLVGVDIFIYDPCSAKALIEKIEKKDFSPFSLERITNRGVKIWPEGLPETVCIEQWRIRFFHQSNCLSKDIHTLLQMLDALGLDCIKTENLYFIGNAPGFSSAEKN